MGLVQEGREDREEGQGEGVVVREEMVGGEEGGKEMVGEMEEEWCMVEDRDECHIGRSFHSVRLE